MLFENILFINLDERTDRLEHVINEFSKLGDSCRYERVSAIKMKNGAIGCSLSHLKCLDIAKQNKWPFVFICEDDITFLNPVLLLENTSKFHQEYCENFDVLIIGGNNCSPFKIMSDFHIQIFNCQTTTGYIVASHYYDILMKNIEDGIEMLIKHPRKKNKYAIDIYWKLLQREEKSRWYMIIPSTVIQYENYSNIEERNTNYASFMLNTSKTIN